MEMGFNIKFKVGLKRFFLGLSIIQNTFDLNSKKKKRGKGNRVTNSFCELKLYNVFSKSSIDKRLG